MNEGLSYSATGVDIDRTDAAKRRMARAVDSGDPRVLNKLGAVHATMSLVLAVILLSVVLSGCARGPSGSSSSGVAKPTSAPSGATASNSTLVPADDPSLPRTDTTGHTPADVLLALIAASQRHDWRTEYSLYATPSATFKTASREWVQADERYQDFTVQETRMVGEGKGDAIVRVTYTCETTPSNGSRHTVSVKPPGEWWTLEKIGGLWKVSWLARQ